mgnify:FL=1
MVCPVGQSPQVGDLPEAPFVCYLGVPEFEGPHVALLAMETRYTVKISANVNKVSQLRKLYVLTLTLHSRTPVASVTSWLNLLGVFKSLR